jgi:RNA polymerase sigma-70 factor (ECF subfamily)
VDRTNASPSGTRAPARSGTAAKTPAARAADPDSALLARLRAGDDGAFETLVRAYGPRLYATARRLLRAEEDARDAVQDAFLQAFRGLDRFAGDARLSTWLHRIVVNAALMKLRTRRRKPEASIDDLLPKFLDDGHQAEPASPWRRAPETPLEREQVRALVRSKIDELPESYRVVLVLRDVEELDTEETAALLGLSANAVKTRLHRARQALRQLLDPHFRSGSLT